MPDSGLYRPRNGRDACGGGLAITIDGNKDHSVVEQGRCMPEQRAQCGAKGVGNHDCDSPTGGRNLQPARKGYYRNAQRLLLRGGNCHATVRQWKFAAIRRE